MPKYEEGMGITPGQWQRVKELYEAAQTWSGEERSTRLDSEPDALVRAEVLRLLSEERKVGSFLSTPAFARNDPDTSPKRLAHGQILAGRFRVLEFLAAGGMGEVYKAEDTRLDRLVALKFLPREVAQDCESLERLHREAKAASSLNHPHICTIYDFGEDAARAFISMEYLEGETLSTRLKNGPLPVAEALDIALQIASALSAAHKKGIIHRDLKPGNIMLTGAGPKLLDFGLAKHERPAPSPSETVTALTAEAHVVGTLPYMSPEQLKGLEVDVRSDIFAFGAVLYEMLTAIRAFQRRSSSETIIAVDRENPPPLRSLVKDVPEPLERIVHRCLQKQPEKRYSSVDEIEHALAALRSETLDETRGFNTKLLARKLKSPRVALPFAALLLLLLSGSAWWMHHSLNVRWARETALPRISDLIAQENIAEAYSLAVQAERYIPQNPALQKSWPDISWSNSITTRPPGASVYRRAYNTPNSPWEFVGRTPMKEKRFAAVDTRWKFEMPGHETIERATFPSFTFSPAVITMDEKGTVPVGMVHVDLITPDGKPPEVGLYGLPGLETSPTIPIESYWIDRYEVTNAEFKRFVEQGGYQKPQYWKHEFKKDGRVLSWSDAMKLFRDSAGQPGPATWSYGKYPQGEDSYPVTGVSWFEAAAYAEFAGKALPTIYHWRVAARGTGASIIPASNFRGQGAAAVGTYKGMSVFGVYDMAGNAKEWAFNEDVSGKRFILGGAWSEPSYTFYDVDARSPFQRSPTFGFRCAKYLSALDFEKAANPITAQVRDYKSEKPVSDQLFEAYKSLYSYDKTPLHAVVDLTKQTNDWREEKITFDAAYGNERVIAYLFLPSKAKPPYQTVLIFPAAGALYTQSSADLDGYFDPDESIDFMIKSGRAVMFPIYKGTFERGANRESSPWPNTTSSYRDRMIMWSKDLGRSIDYLETRRDIDHEKLAYEGYSLGAALGSLLPGVGPRFKALVLICGGFWLQKRLPESDQINFAPRIRAPVLMLNGRFDYVFPVASSQDPMFRLLGAPGEHKRHVLYDTGHDVPYSEVVKETLNWLDRYLGPVK